MSTLQRTMKCLVVFTLASGAAFGSRSEAAEVRLLSSAGIKPVVDAMKSQFETSTGHTLAVKYVLTPQVATLAEAGEPFDVAIASPSYIKQIAKLNKIAGTPTDIAKFDLGLGIRAGAAKPNISTPEALKHALLAAKSISYVGGGATAPLVMGVLEQLGIKDQARLVAADGVASSLSAVADGAVEMVLLTVPLIKEAKGLDLAGPLPAPFQNTIVMTAGVSNTAQDRAAADALVALLMSAEANPIVAAKGYERVTRAISAR